MFHPSSHYFNINKTIIQVVKDWEDLPPMFARVDIRPLLQDAAIDDVEMEEAGLAVLGLTQDDEPEEEVSDVS